MTDDLERQVREALRRRKRFPVVLMSVVLLAVIAAAGAGACRAGQGGYSFDKAQLTDLSSRSDL
jgi:hypothetical protein